MNAPEEKGGESAAERRARDETAVAETAAEAPRTKKTRKECRRELARHSALQPLR